MQVIPASAQGKYDFGCMARWLGLALIWTELTVKRGKNSV